MELRIGSLANYLFFLSSHWNEQESYQWRLFYDFGLPIGCEYDVQFPNEVQQEGKQNLQNGQGLEKEV